MIKHIVMFKIREYKSEQDKISKINSMKSYFEGLKDEINEIESYEIGINFNLG